MSAEFKWFRDVNTGQVAKYPARYGERFATLEEVDSEDAGCLDCLVTSEPDTDVYPEDVLSVDEFVSRFNDSEDQDDETEDSH